MPLVGPFPAQLSIPDQETGDLLLTCIATRKQILSDKLDQVITPAERDRLLILFYKTDRLYADVLEACGDD